jgi:hypothetical protein
VEAYATLVTKLVVWAVPILGERVFGFDRVVDAYLKEWNHGALPGLVGGGATNEGRRK